MKLAITSQGKDMLSAVDPRFGRARWFIVVDTETGELNAVDNQLNRDMTQGAGIQAALSALNVGAQAVVTGNVGPKAFSALKAAGLDVYVGATGTVQEAFERFKAGELKSAEGATVEGPWV
jgi:predicted Fe-Mo cluster-binding NifX family protein